MQNVISAAHREIVRQDTRAKLAAMAELKKKDAWGQLVEHAFQIREKKPDLDEDAAFIQACQEHPILYQEWQDSLPEVPLAQDHQQNHNTMKITATQKLEAIAESMVTAGTAPNLDAGLAEAVHANPDLYRESLGEKVTDPAMEEINAAFAGLDAGSREQIERRATEIYLSRSGITEADSRVLAAQDFAHMFK